MSVTEILKQLQTNHAVYHNLVTDYTALQLMEPNNQAIVSMKNTYQRKLIALDQAMNALRSIENN